MSRDRMTVVEHLEELRRRLLWVVLSLAAASAVGWFLSPRILAVLLQPAHRAGVHLITLAPGELFLAYIKVALLTGLLLTLPVLLYQVAAFAWPGLEPSERRALLLLLPVGMVLFLGGAAFAYTVMLGYLFQFFFGFQAPGVTPNLSVAGYLAFVINLLLPFGFVFQLPVLLAVLAKLDLVSAEFLARNRKFAILIIFIVAAVLTPPDPLSQVIMAVPLMGLYELSLIIVKVLTRRRRP